MEIKSIVLQTNSLMEMKNFYINILGFSLIHEDKDSFRFAAGTGEFEFTTREAAENPFYHFAFNIPANKFNEAKLWAKERVSLLVEDGLDEVHFSHFPAHAFYFYDPSGNIVELISRYEIAEISNEPFSAKSVLNISEIGLVVKDAVSVSEKLNEIGLTERDNDAISRTSLNFMGERSSGIFIILAQPGRRWIFSDKVSAIFPLEITFINNIKVMINSQNELQIYRDEHR
ncbi:Glyoxalase/Bleomycin resistance protein/Dioxygenase superfamily protein [Bacillus sp. OV322]|uniref:VOC family protein n=1 Tax=Bacillus sp. OV322 TaxID=1882764 RepID=UPI0008F4449C|nr:VOC family protein [Bacillus sp. OV322]SFC94969.1 Glyoxalase/Bleomycin resistance protein/Dioxygenase superfamily protein [Bacillus sp. OV322]